MAIDFTSPAWTEVDPGADITVAASKITATNVLSRQDTFYVYRDMGAAYFSGDFTHKFEVEFSGSGIGSICCFWMLANSVNDFLAVRSASEDGVVFYYEDGSDRFILNAIENGALGAEDAWVGPSASTIYFITITRDYNGGVNNTGQYNCYIRTGSHAGALQATLSLDCSVGEQNDFRYIYALTGYDDNNTVNTISVFTQNLDIDPSTELVANDASHVHTADSPAIIQILSILAVNDSSHAQTADSPTLLAIYDLLVNDTSHVFTADSPLLVVYLAVLDAIHAMSADSPVLSFIPAETLRMIFTGKVPGVNFTAAVPKVQLTGRTPGVEFE